MEKLLAQTNSSLAKLNTSDLGVSNCHSVSMLYLQLALGFKQQALSSKQQVTPDMPRKTKSEAEQTRLGIMGAALTVFSDKGVSRSSLADIAREAGVTRGAIYWHFENKSDLMQKIMRHYFDGIDESILEQHKELKGEELLLQGAESWLKTIETNKDLQKLLEISFFKMEHSGEMSAFREIESSLLQADISQLAEVLQYSVDSGNLRVDADLHAMSISVISAIQGGLMQWILLKQNFPLSTVLISSINALLNSIRTKPQY